MYRIFFDVVQIEQQQQLLVAKEQRLKYLKQQEYQQHQMASEYDKLRRWGTKNSSEVFTVLPSEPPAFPLR